MRTIATLFGLAAVLALTACPAGTTGDDDDDAGGCLGTITMTDSGTAGFEQAYLCWDAATSACATGEGTDRCAGVAVTFRYRSDLSGVIDHPAYAAAESPWVLDSGSPGNEIDPGNEFSELAEWPDGSTVNATFSNSSTGDSLSIEFENTGLDITLLAVGP